MKQKNNCKYIEVAPYVVCKDAEHVRSYFQDIIDGGGEGIILRDPLAPLVGGRSHGYLKHKVFFYFFHILEIFKSLHIFNSSAFREA